MEKAFNEILEIIDAPHGLHETAQRLAAKLRTYAGCDAVGIRLREGNDFPYIAHDGFTKEFLRSENTLLERDYEGGLCRDKDGGVILECTCGLVILGGPHKDHPLFTEGGSAWTNDSLSFSDPPSGQDPRNNPRNRCLKQGYSSVALVPMRCEGKVIGLINFSIRRKDGFTLEMIEQLELLARQVGSCLLRKKAEENYRALFNRMTAGVVQYEVIYDREGNVADYCFLDVNPAFERMTGLKKQEIRGRAVKDVLPCEEPCCVEKYGKKVMAGETVHFEYYSDRFQMHLDVMCYLTQPAILVCVLTDITDHMLDEKEISSGSAYFKVLFSESPVSIIVHDADTGEVLDANEAAYTSYGFSSLDEMKTGDIWLDPPYSQKDALSMVRKAVSEGTQTAHWPGRKITGEIFWEEVCLKPITIDGAKRVLAISVDITDSKKSYEALQKSQHRYKAVFNGVSDAIFVADAKTKDLVDCNEKALELTGYTRDEIISMNAEQLHPEESREEAMSIFDKGVMGEKDPIETTLVSKGGENIEVAITNAVIQTEDGVYLTGIMRDVKQENQYQRLVQDSEERFRLMAEKIPLGVQGYYLSGSVFYWNQKSEQIYGYTSEEAIGKDLGDLIIPEEVKPLYRRGLAVAGKMTASGEFAPPGEVELMRKDGSRIPVYSTHLLVLRTDKDPELYCIDLDISEAKKREVQEKKHLRELEIFYEASIGREERIVELKKEVKRLEKELEGKA